MIETQTLPGWPAAYDPSLLDLLVVTLLVPLGIAAVFAVLLFAPVWREKQQD
ncbi:MAG: hypothetical protein LCH76_08450 [Actinobacteria bacterium]|nr:hypothetical protein [Actinomycetota bacterium]